jgi:hypothetical protein
VAVARREVAGVVAELCGERLVGAPQPREEVFEQRGVEANLRLDGVGRGRALELELGVLRRAPPRDLRGVGARGLDQPIGGLALVENLLRTHVSSRRMGGDGRPEGAVSRRSRVGGKRKCSA